MPDLKQRDPRQRGRGLPQALSDLALEEEHHDIIIPFRPKARQCLPSVGLLEEH